MWVNVSDRIDFTENRIIVMIPETVLVNMGIPRNKVFSLMGRDEFNEAFVFSIISRLGFSYWQEWKLLQAAYNMEWQSIDVVVSSPRFPKSADGGRLPVVLNQEQLDGLSWVPPENRKEST